ncbi:MAG: AAA family ATPase [Gammaproteobacteria bacterium]
MTTKQPSIFKTFASDLLAAEKDSAQALKDYPQIALIIDTLSRKNNHHVALSGFRSEKVLRALLESLALHLTDGNAPQSLRDVDFIFFDAKRLALHTEDPKKIVRDFNEFCYELQENNKRIVFAVNQLDTTETFGKLIQSISMDDHWRLILLDDSQERYGFTNIKLAAPIESQLLALLKTCKPALETFHHVIIPEETFTSALSMAMHYLPSHSYFDKALDLLDSTAARASAMERNDPTGQFKPLVTTTTLALIISSWTQIPITHMHSNSFQAAKFVEAMQRRIFGQETAIATMASVLQHACIKIQEKPGPLCSFLLVGPAEAGKTTAAHTIAEHLFGHRGALLRVNLSETVESIDDVKIMSDDNHGVSLLSAIQQKPYAVILIENIHHAPAAMFNLFKNIFSYGFALDAQGNKYDFSHAIIVITTTLGSERITTLMQAPIVHETNKTLDLMQLVLNDHPHDDHEVHHQLSPQELYEELLPTLEGYFSATMLQHLHIIPFLPLDYAALEKVIRLKVKALAKRLETNFGIELNYAPEVIKFLAHETLWRKPITKPIDKLLEQHLYSAVSNEILAHSEDKNRPRRLFLQLNENGQLLRCEFISAMGATIYNL